MLKKKELLEIITIIIGSALVAFAIVNIHTKLPISEGGQLGVELLLLHWFNISPSITSIIIDFTCYIIGVIFLSKRFALNAIIGTLSYSLFYFIFDTINIPYLLPNNMLIISIVAGVLVGIGSGLVVKKEGACGGDDSLAQVIHKITKLPLSLCYFSMDVVIILCALSYIPLNYIFYSLLTSLISSIIIELVAKE